MGDQERHHRAMSMALINDPRHWRERAEEARRIAEDMADPDAKRMMLIIAAGYDRLAQHADTRLLTGTCRMPGH